MNAVAEFKFRVRLVLFIGCVPLFLNFLHEYLTLRTFGWTLYLAALFTCLTIFSCLVLTPREAHRAVGKVVTNWALMAAFFAIIAAMPGLALVGLVCGGLVYFIYGRKPSND